MGVGPDGAGVPLGARHGTVVSFDDPRGLGEVRADEGVDYPFHCTAVADGSRSISVGTSVAFRVVAGRLGRWEATGLVVGS
jgi:cold shock CspA family protein